MTPFIDVNTKISSVGSKVFEIQRKVYADSCPIKKPSGKSSHGHGHHGGHGGTKASMADSSASTLFNTGPGQLPPLVAMMNAFTEATANAYQEWNVVKKNKFGRRQERIFGVDGKKIYNAKRGALRGGNQQGVHRAERDIATIVKIDILSDDTNGSAGNGGGGTGMNGQTVSTTGGGTNHNTSSGFYASNTHNNTASNKDLPALANSAAVESLGSRTFRITWAESNDIYNIEYTTDTSRECLEIVAKVKYLMNRLKRGGGGTH
jgi:hypothetical protein